MAGQPGRPKGLGKTPGSGRKKGTPNRLKQQSFFEAKYQAAKRKFSRNHPGSDPLDPLDFFISVLNNQTAPLKERAAAAKQLINFQYAKPSSAFDEMLQGQNTPTQITFTWGDPDLPAEQQPFDPAQVTH